MATVARQSVIHLISHGRTEHLGSSALHDGAHSSTCSTSALHDGAYSSNYIIYISSGVTHAHNDDDVVVKERTRRVLDAGLPNGGEDGLVPPHHELSRLMRGMPT